MCLPFLYFLCISSGNQKGLASVMVYNTGETLLQQGIEPTTHLEIDTWLKQLNYSLSPHKVFLFFSLSTHGDNRQSDIRVV